MGDVRICLDCERVRDRVAELERVVLEMEVDRGIGGGMAHVHSSRISI